MISKAVSHPALINSYISSSQTTGTTSITPSSIRGYVIRFFKFTSLSRRTTAYSLPTLPNHEHTAESAHQHQISSSLGFRHCHRLWSDRTEVIQRFDHANTERSKQIYDDIATSNVKECRVLRWRDGEAGPEGVDRNREFGKARLAAEYLSMAREDQGVVCRGKVSGAGMMSQSSHVLAKKSHLEFVMKIDQTAI